MSDEDVVSEPTAIDLQQVLNFAHRGWCDTGLVPLDSGVQLSAFFGLDPQVIVDMFDLGLHPTDIVELLEEGRNLKEIQQGNFNEDELIERLFQRRKKNSN